MHLTSQIQIRPLEGEVIAPEDYVDVVVSLNMFRMEKHVVRVPSGSTLEECVKAAEKVYVGSKPAHLVVQVGDEYIYPEYWSRVRVKPGAFVVIKGMPGKDSGFMRSLFMILIAVAAIAATVVLGPAGLGLVTATTASLIGTAILVGGSLLINTLIPIRPPVLESTQGASTSPTYSVSGGSNEADPFGPVPFVLGKHRVFPKYAAKPWTEFISNNQFLYMLFCWGYGPTTAPTQVKIGETAIENFQSVTTQVDTEFLPNESTLNLFPTEVIEQSLSIELIKLHEVVQTSSADATSLAIDIVLPNGLFKIDEDSGKRKEHDLKIDLFYRKVGTTAWKSFDSQFRQARKTQKALRYTLTQTVAKGQYEVQLIRLTDNDEANESSVSIWTALRSFRTDKPIEFPFALSCTAIKIKATGQLNGVVSALNGIIESKQLSYNGSTWVPNTTSQNPANLFRYVLQGPFNERPVDDSQIDITRLEAWWAFCDTNGFKFNMYRDFRTSVWECLSDVAAAGRGFPCFVDGKWSVCFDDPTAPIVGHYTPRNSRNFTEERPYIRFPHAYRVRFINEQKGYKEDERIVYDEGFNVSNASKFEQIEFPGCTNADLAFKHAKYYITQLRERAATYTLIVSREHFRNTVGDRIRVQHYLPQWGLTSGRVKTVDGVTITLDDPVKMEIGKVYSIRFTRPGGDTTFTRDIITAPGLTTVVTLTGAGTAPVADDLFSFGEAGLETKILRIKKISPSDASEAKLTLEDDAQEATTASNETPDTHVSNVKSPTDLSTAFPKNLQGIETTPAVGEVLDKIGIDVSWNQPVIQNTTVDVTKIEYKPTTETDWIVGPTIPGSQLDVTLEDLTAGSFSVRAKNLFDNGLESDWTQFDDITVVGKSAVPEDITGLSAAVNADFIRLYWNPITSLGFDHYIVRYSPLLVGAEWSSAQIVQDNLKTPLAQLPTLVGTYLVKAVNVESVESANAAEYASNVAALNALNAILQLDEHPNFVGEKVSTEVNSNILRLTQIGGLLSWPAILTINETHWTSQFPYDAGYLYPDHIDLGAVYTSRVTAFIDAAGENINNVIGNWGPIGSIGLIGGDNASQWTARYEERRISDTTVIDRTTGTNIGNMTGGGNLAASFDGDNTEDNANSSSRAAVTSAYIGKTFAVAKKISHAVIYGSTASGFSSGTGSITLELYGKNGGAPANATDGTLLGSRTFTDRNDGTPFLIVNEIDDVTQWAHGWVRIAVGASATLYCAELELYENTGTGWTDWAEVLAAADYSFRFIDRRLVLRSLAPDVRPLVSEASFLVDMPDTFRAAENITIGSDGMRVDFSPPFRVVAGIGVSAQNLDDAVRILISGLDETGFNVTAKDAANAFVSGQIFSYNAKGAGAQTL